MANNDELPLFPFSKVDFNLFDGETISGTVEQCFHRCFIAFFVKVTFFFFILLLFD